MKAAILKSIGAPLVVEDVADPVLGTGEVIVDVAASRVLPYMGEVLDGRRAYLIKTPMIPGPGGVGRVSAIGPDVTKLKLGDWVYCDPTIRARDDAVSPDIILQGLTAGSPQAAPLQEYHHDGSFAERMRTPTENVTRLGEIAADDAPAWCALGTSLVPYGGLLAGGLQPGKPCSSAARPAISARLASPSLSRWARPWWSRLAAIKRCSTCFRGVLDRACARSN